VGPHGVPADLDDWGGFDDHVVTPNLEHTPDGVRLGYGPRVPLLIFGGPVKQTVDSRWKLSVPAALDGVVTAVLGLDDRPQARAWLRVAAAAAAVSYTAGSGEDLPDARRHGWHRADASDHRAGRGFGQSDLDTYFSGLGSPTPVVTAVGVDGAGNTPGQDPQGADGEVLLDIEVAGVVVPKASIVVYFTPNTDAGFLDAVSTAAHASATQPR
jgi:kumamolisin